MAGDWLKVKCRECMELFDLDKNGVEEGDEVECPECSENLIVKVVKGKLKLATHKEKLHDYDEIEFDDE
ncbi:MAG: hypothetical protein HYW50_00110 [Candidatus Diapherotrites archaeon]|nr:hypothetical protein [Candidatus Diapherotrites archaeon]